MHPPLPRGWKRLTPARAGSTRCRPGSPGASRAHPRSRGEHPSFRRKRSRWAGSPPLARGARRRGDAPEPGQGLTPARAGSTPRTRSRRSRRTAHPRSRGEHRQAQFVALLRSGSPPLARGAPGYDPGQSHHWGLTPARAGSTARCMRRPLSPWAHPRSRGEHLLPTSSERIVRLRLTPARAGSTNRPRDRVFSTWAHPRSRGEHYWHQLAPTPAAGSPPLARGAPRKGRHLVPGRGLTPARAGSTRRSSARAMTSRAHPRSRGEHQVHRCAGDQRQGLTPARAGSTGRRPRPA